MGEVAEEYRMTEAERFTFDLAGFLVRPAIITCARNCVAMWNMHTFTTQCLT